MKCSLVGLLVGLLIDWFVDGCSIGCMVVWPVGWVATDTGRMVGTVTHRCMCTGMGRQTYTGSRMSTQRAWSRGMNASQALLGHLHGYVHGNGLGYGHGYWHRY